LAFDKLAQLTLPAVLQLPVTIDRLQLPQIRVNDFVGNDFSDQSMAIIPYQPTLQAVLISLWAAAQPDVAESVPSAPLSPPAKKCLTSLFEAASSETSGHVGQFMSLPKAISKSRSRKPINLEACRRSPRLQNQSGYMHTSLENLPKKRRLGSASTSTSDSSTSCFNLDAPPSLTDGIPPPIPLKTLQDWGIQCSVPPSEVTDDQLLSSKSQDADKT